MKLDPIIAVQDVEVSSKWYQSVFGCKSMHGGNEFDVLVTDEGGVLICLHKWGEHNHETMKDSSVTPGNGLILYFRVKDMDTIHQNLVNLNYEIHKEIELNPNSSRKEFSVIDPDGYFLTISEYHEFLG